MIDLDKVKGTYWSDILDQPRAIRDTVDALEPVAALEALAADLRRNRFRRVVLTGMGGSYQILHPLHLRLIAAGFDSILAETSELLHSMPSLLDARNLVIVVSQSGASAEIVRLMEHAGPTYVAVTNTAGSPLATRAHVNVLTRAGAEGGVSCKTAVTSLAALYWIGQHLIGGDLDKAREALYAVAPAVQSYVDRWPEHVAELVSELGEAKRAFFAGRGSSMAAVGLGAMVQKEAAHFHGEGMSSAALRHGPFEMLGPDSFVVVYAGAENVRALNGKLVRDVLETGAKARLCGFGADGGAFALPRVDNELRPIVELLPPQMMSLALGYLGGREPGKFERITKVTTVE